MQFRFNMRAFFCKIRFNPASLLLVLLLPTIVLVALPGIVIDALVIISFITSIMLLVIMLENDQPLNVTFLPTIILLLTTFRLLLSIATTRNIIANEDVGKVIEVMGDFVMQGSLVSGLLIFTIITIVQFLVITKGGERVAEVAARFSLDAMPGRQMTIDGDLKAGLITGQEAQNLRAELSSENKMFGSLDGAMKFVKGDAIAGILISIVNLFGGIYIGVNTYKLSLVESVSKFSVLTIGDGLVSQIPSLLLSLSCGVYLTRVKSDENIKTSFIKQLIGQVSSYWRVLFFLSLFIMLLGVLVKDLFYICSLFSLLISAIAAIKYRNENIVDNTIERSSQAIGTGVYSNLKFIVNKVECKNLILERVSKVENQLWGLNLGVPEIKIDTNLSDGVDIYISDFKVYELSTNKIKENIGGVINVCNESLFYFSGEIYDDISDIVDFFLLKTLNEKYNLQHTSDIFESLSTESEIIKSEIDAAIGINRVHDVLKEMIRSPDFYLDKVSFFEGLLNYSRIEDDSNNWFVRLRSKAKYCIIKNLLKVFPDKKIKNCILSYDLMELINDFVTDEINDYEELAKIQSLIRDKIRSIIKEAKAVPILIVNKNEYNTVKAFFNKIALNLIICCHDDIPDLGMLEESYILNIMDKNDAEVEDVENVEDIFVAA